MVELLSQFGVDWRLLLAQVVNFGILIFLLKHYAYGPIIKVLRERREKIESGIKASEESERKLLLASEEKKQILIAAETEASKIVSAAASVALEESKSILENTHKKSNAIVDAGKKTVESDRLKLYDEVESHAHALIKKGLAATIGKMNASERDEVLITEALKTLRTVR